MISCERKPICLAAIAVALWVAGALGYVSSNALASDRAATASKGSSSADIRVAKGKLSGKFSNRPLFEVLDAIGSQAGFEYQVDKALLNHPVSGNFKAAPLVDAVRKILEPFNYVIVSKANGEIRRLHIVGFRGASPASLPAEPRVPPETRRPALEFSNEPETSKNLHPTIEEQLAALTVEERLAFEVADEKLGPPPEWLDYFEPASEHGSADEVFSSLTIEQRRSFEIADEKLGPPPELLEYFEPVPEPGSAETGPPIPPGMIVEDLPQFEPYVSETGPSADTPEND